MLRLATLLLLSLGLLLTAACDRSSPAEPMPVQETSRTAPSHPPALPSEPTFHASTAEEVSEHVITVYHSPSCGCCYKWVDHLRENGFDVKEILMDDVRPVKVEHKLPRALGSCHTAVVDGYVVEGHVPADTIHRILSERPEITGVAVPGMPMGSPGMEGAYSEAYDIIAFDAQGNTSVYESITP